MLKDAKVLTNLGDVTFIDVFNIAMHKGVCTPANVLEWRPHNDIKCAITIYLVDGSKIIFIPTLEQLLEVASKKEVVEEDNEVEEEPVSSVPGVRTMKILKPHITPPEDYELPPNPTDSAEIEKPAKKRGRPRKTPILTDTKFPFISQTDLDLLKEHGRVQLNENEFRSILKLDYDSEISLRNVANIPLTDTLSNLVDKFVQDIKKLHNLDVKITSHYESEVGFLYDIEAK